MKFIREKYIIIECPLLYNNKNLHMELKKYLASLDQSTTTTKFSLYHLDGTLVDKQYLFHQQISKHEGWLEHDPKQIIQNVQKSISAVIQRMKGQEGFSTEQILGLGLCNQRQTIICWDKDTHQPLHNAIVWCDSRTKKICQKIKQQYGNFTAKTGLPVSTYFSIFKIIWLLENVQGLKQKAKEGQIRFGTIDTWVALHLTGKFVTDASNASRTHLMDINTGKWDKKLLQIAQISQLCLPQIIDSFHSVGNVLEGDLKGVPLTCILGDQQSSAFAHNLSSTQMKITYGTGCFMLSNIGEQPIYDESFVTTILHQNQDKREYGFEVSVECGGGTINWAKRINLFEKYDELNQLSSSQSDGEVYFMPSFGTIFSPFWQSDVKGGLIGINFNTTKENILKSILDSITFRLWDNIKDEKFKKVTKIIVDGGMTINKQFMQMQADLFGKDIEVRPLDTCWGVAKGVLTALKIKQSIKEFQSVIYKPNPEKQDHYLKRYQKWVEVRNKFYGWAK